MSKKLFIITDVSGKNIAAIPCINASVLPFDEDILSPIIEGETGGEVELLKISRVKSESWKVEFRSTGGLFNVTLSPIVFIED